MEWTVLIGDEFEPEFFALSREVQDETLALTRLLQQFGPHLGRPHADTLKDSRHANMKELPSTLLTEPGAWPSLSTRRAGPSCL